eukprot:TRINITY_DN17378_c0_g2_i1.p1 TRINITY_DN17378_c0_g2~~TRINITY_DN17378_c0_g2_i1.p1  ORF type:complete len:325 (-),score=49.70 TRINITY_DN17378_c0_g2_i1:838-1755(-)
MLRSLVGSEMCIRDRCFISEYSPAENRWWFTLEGDLPRCTLRSQMSVEETLKVHASQEYPITPWENQERLETECQASWDRAVLAYQQELRSTGLPSYQFDVESCEDVKECDRLESTVYHCRCDGYMYKLWLLEECMADPAMAKKLPGSLLSPIKKRKLELAFGPEHTQRVHDVECTESPPGSDLIALFSDGELAEEWAGHESPPEEDWAGLESPPEDPRWRTRTWRYWIRLQGRLQSQKQGCRQMAGSRHSRRETDLQLHRLLGCGRSRASQAKCYQTTEEVWEDHRQAQTCQCNEEHSTWCCRW